MIRSEEARGEVDRLWAEPSKAPSLLFPSLSRLDFGGNKWTESDPQRTERNDGHEFIYADK